MRNEDAHNSHAHAGVPVRSEDELRRMGYETDDVGVATILRWVVFMFVFVFASLVVTYFIYLVFVPGDNTQAEINAQSPLLSQKRLPPPDAPILQAAPKQDWKDFTRQADEKVHTYGWVNPSRGVVKIPVERAIDLLAERGIPVPPAPAPQPQAAGVASNAPAAAATQTATPAAQPGLVGSSNTLSGSPDIGTGSSTYGAR